MHDIATSSQNDRHGKILRLLGRFSYADGMEVVVDRILSALPASVKADFEVSVVVGQHCFYEHPVTHDVYRVETSNLVKMTQIPVIANDQDFSRYDIFSLASRYSARLHTYGVRGERACPEVMRNNADRRGNLCGCTRKTHGGAEFTHVVYTFQLYRIPPQTVFLVFLALARDDVPRCRVTAQIELRELMPTPSMYALWSRTWVLQSEAMSISDHASMKWFDMNRGECTTVDSTNGEDRQTKVIRRPWNYCVRDHQCYTYIYVARSIRDLSKLRPTQRANYPLLTTYSNWKNPPHAVP